jgi:hypothetical protein
MTNRNGDWTATHRITMEDGCRYDVMLTDDGPAFTLYEWRTESAADFELVNGEWLFLGRPFVGEVLRYDRSRKVCYAKGGKSHALNGQIVARVKGVSND